MIAPTGFGPGIEISADAVKNATVKSEKRFEAEENDSIMNKDFVGKENDPRVRGAESNMDIIMNS